MSSGLRGATSSSLRLAGFRICSEVCLRLEDVVGAGVQEIWAVQGAFVSRCFSPRCGQGRLRGPGRYRHQRRLAGSPRLQSVISPQHRKRGSGDSGIAKREKRVAAVSLGLAKDLFLAPCGDGVIGTQQARRCKSI